MLKIAICGDNVQELDNTYSMAMNFSKTRPEIELFIDVARISG